MGVFGGKIGEGTVRYWPLENSFFLYGVLTTVPILVKIDQEKRPWQTDANRFLANAIILCRRPFRLSVCRLFATFVRPTQAIEIDAEISAIRPQIRVYCIFLLRMREKLPYFHFRSKIWRHHGVLRPRFPIRRGNFGDSRTFKADNYSIT